MAHASHVFVSIRAGGATESVEKKSKLTSTPWPALHFAKKAVLRRFEKRREQNARAKTTDMRPECDTRLRRIAHQCAGELHHEQRRNPDLYPGNQRDADPNPGALARPQSSR